MIKLQPVGPRWFAINLSGGSALQMGGHYMRRGVIRGRCEDGTTRLAQLCSTSGQRHIDP